LNDQELYNALFSPIEVTYSAIFFASICF
jgi:hypothetical protein